MNIKQKTILIIVIILAVISLLIADFMTKPFVIFNKILESKPYKYYLFCFINFAFAITEILWIHSAFKTVYSSVIECLIYGCIIGLLNLVISFVFFYLTKQLTFLKRLRKED